MSATNLKYKDIYFDSDEEVYMAMWLQELLEAGFVARWSKTSMSFHMTSGLKRDYVKETQLKTKLKKETKTQTLLRPSEYTPDFIVNFTQSGLQAMVGSLAPESVFIPNMLFYKNTPDVVIEVKPTFDQNNMERLFVLNQKFLWEKEKVFVNLVEPIELFKKTFVPSQAMPYLVYRKKPTSAKNKHKNVGDFKFDFQPKSLNEYLCL